MKKIKIYADFDFLESPQEIGTLGYEHIRGNDHFAFEYTLTGIPTLYKNTGRGCIGLQL